MKYCSTRGGVCGKSFEEVLFTSYAQDGGLFMPENIPKVGAERLLAWSKLSYVELCKAISRLFISEAEVPTDKLNGLITKAFSRGFDHKDIIPVVKVQDVYVAELWHGATMAFKDLALSCVAQFMAFFNEKSKRHVTVIVSTSGDTGGAAIESVRDSIWIDIVVMFPKGCCSKVQELQMTTVLEDNVHVFCGEGTSDDLDIPLKKCLKNQELVRQHGLCSINSINWARIMIQIAHHFYTYFQATAGIHDNFAGTVIVPTGGAGNITAGVIACLMGLPIRLVAATNVNDILHRALSSGDFSLAEVIPTVSPAMDIQAPYNMERILYLFSGADQVASLMNSYEKTGKMEIPLGLREKIGDFLGSKSVCHEEIVDMIKACWFKWDYLIDPHTAVGMVVACQNLSVEALSKPCVVLSTAHADKFPETMSSIGIEHRLCERIQCLWKKPTKYQEMKRGDNWDKILLDTVCSITESRMYK